MSVKARIKRAEGKIQNAREQLEFIWLEQDEAGNHPPPRPGEKVINLKWDEARDPTPDPDQDGPN